MKKFANRSLAIIIVFVMLLSMLPAVSFQASAADYVYNWGQREVLCTELSDSAIAWYAAEGASYEELSALSGASSEDSVPSSALYNVLQTLMANAHDYKTSYDATKDMYAYTDCENGGGKISSFYSGKAIGPAWDGGSTWNREHTWPNSKGLEGSDEDDIMMLRPTAVSENIGRSNTAYGESSGYYHPNSESNGAHDLRGDCARICLYVYVRWGNKAYMWGSNGVMESKEVLLSWMEADPVDTWEMGRNDSVESITGTRNVFVDYPELAFDLFEEPVPDMDTPSGGTESYTITATSSNTSHGTVSLSGKTITASPETGYYASGYQVTSGSATVTQSGNTFTVNATSDCTVQIQFAAKTSVTVSFSGAGSIASQTGYAGEAMTLPSVTAPEGFSFLGWTSAKLSSDTTEEPSYYTGTFYPTASTTLYALYTYTEGGTGETKYVLVTDASTLSAGAQVIIASNSKGFVAGDISSQYLAKLTASFSDDLTTITSLPENALILTLGGSAGAWTLANSDGNLLGATAVKKLAWDSGTTTWSISISDNNATIQNGTSSYGRFLYNVNSPRFTTYISDTSTSMLLPQLYMKQVVGTTYYTSNTTTCSHSNTTTTTVDATCTTDGSVTVTCDSCGDVISTEAIPATGHSYGDWEIITKATYTEEGSQQKSCSCGDVVTEAISVLADPITSWNITLRSNIGINFVTSLTDEAIVCTVAGNPVEVSLTEGKISISLAAVQMTDEIAFTVNGLPLANTYSVRGYADVILAGEYSDTTKELVRQMLNYGAASQTMFGYKTDNLANTDISVTAQAPTGEAGFDIQGAVEDIDFSGATLVYRDRIAVRFYFTASSIEGITFKANDVACDPVAKNGMYYIEVADINPQELDTDITVVVNDSLSVTYAPMDYIIRMYNKASSSDATKALVQALYGYYEAAEAYTG